MVENRSRTVAVIDDDEAVLESFRFMLELAGFPVATYSSATAFLDDATSQPLCLILDHHMPWMTGLDLTAKLRAEGSVVPVLLITSAPSQAIFTRAAAVGVAQVLEKPVAEADVITFVRGCY